jgi:hypothetical protein
MKPIHPVGDGSLEAALDDARLRAKERAHPCKEVVLAHVLVPVLIEWINEQPKREQNGMANDQKMILGQLAYAAKVPPRRLYGLLHGEDISLNLDTADRLMEAIGLHVRFIEEGIVTTLEASVYANWQRAEVRTWWEDGGRKWPPPSKLRRQMPTIRRAYHAAHGGVMISESR